MRTRSDVPRRRRPAAVGSTDGRGRSLDSHGGRIAVLTIDELARRAVARVETVRFCKREGLITQPLQTCAAGLGIPRR